ncbi:catechol 2,3-dioxygenase-like lactoylglutathione lyase family enzyme [Hephaestia caeni]|uniref:Catechol 2,3-dioxygenase-like lactoylglutathione lyase family enzyme n=1 Tax=Hephaestia caeni TaxID=645617 RepID=A0A397NTB6_9SPHN|nr:VOC family protein [Hephaestia caeni]RIA37965.1 catechol 2,3-dioxygenase-like lactoylglutathione lyase family enzyme [Hephaestia caeni]
MAESFVRSPVRGAHHVAYRCLDAEQTRWFYEDVLGLRLAAALVIAEAPGTGEQLEYMHLFFELGDGKYIAFFDAPGNARPEVLDRKHSFDIHVALEVASEEELLAMQERIRGHGKTCFGPVEHEFVRSIYMYDPNGIQLEVTYRTAKHDAIMAEEELHAREAIAEWSARTRAQKIEMFGAERLEIRKAAA